MDDYTYITFRCAECDNEDCDICPLGTYISSILRGCTRKVTEEEAARYHHYETEVLPFIHTYKNHQTAIETLKEINEYYYYLTHCPLGQKLDKRGKVIQN